MRIASSDGPKDLFPAYAASKRDLNAWTRELAPKLAASGIAINCVSPGWVKTRMGGAEAPETVNDAVQPIVWLSTTDLPPEGQFISGVRVGEPEGLVNLERLPW